jgi:hypothetical protein
MGSDLPEQGRRPVAPAAEATKKTPTVVTKRIYPQASNKRFASLMQEEFRPMKWNKSSSRSLAKERVKLTTPKPIIASLEHGPPARDSGDGGVVRFGETYSALDPAHTSTAEDPSAKAVRAGYL